MASETSTGATRSAGVARRAKDDPSEVDTAAVPDCTDARCRCPYTHEQWQRQVVDLMHSLGWSHLHVRRTIGRGQQWVTATNRKGWPDLFGWHPRRGFVALELKVGSDKATVEQLDVLVELKAAGAQTMVAYPHHLAEVHGLLRAPPAVP